MAGFGLLASSCGCRDESPSPPLEKDTPASATSDSAVGDWATGGSATSAGPEPYRPTADDNAPPADAPKHRDTDTARQTPAFLPLRDATPGEWVQYRTLDGRHLRYEVIDADPADVTTRIRILHDGEPFGVPTTRRDARDFDPVARHAERKDAATSIQTTTIEAAGRNWPATLYEQRWTDEQVPYIRRIWVNPQVPFIGTLRMEQYGGKTLEALLTMESFGNTAVDR